MSGPEDQGEMPWPELRETCGNRKTTPDHYWKDRTGAGIIPGGSAKCGLLVPEQWAKTKLGDLEMARRWLGSGGGPGVFGACSPESCPYRANIHPDHRNALADEGQ